MVDVYLAADYLAADQRIVFKNNAPFLSCISKINGKLVENAEDLDIVMSMYNLLEYSKNYQKLLDLCLNIIEMSRVLLTL